MTAATHARALKAIGLSALLHAAALAGWQPPVFAPAATAQEQIEVALIGNSAPNHRIATPRPPSAAHPRRAIRCASLR